MAPTQPKSRTQNQSGNARPKKRNPVNPSHQACTSCKNRKVRCDAATPRCSYCTAHDKPCVFPPAYKRAKCSQSHVDELEAKLRQYESWNEREAPRSDNASSTILNHDKAPGTPEASSPGYDDSRISQHQQRLSSLRASDQQSWQADAMHLSPECAQELTTRHTVQEANFVGLQKRSDPIDQVAFQRGSQHIDLDSYEIGHSTEGGGTYEARIANPGGLGSDMPDCPSDEADDSEGDQDPDADKPIMDGMVEYVGASPNDLQGEQSFGSSSTFNFALKIKASAVGEGAKSAMSRQDMLVSCDNKGKGTSAFPRPPGTDDGTSYHIAGSDAQAQEENLQALRSYLNQSYLQYLPQRMVAKALVDRYFTAVHTVWPFLIEEATRFRFDKTWSSDEPQSPMWMAQLNLIFALACQFYETEAGAPLPDIYDAGKQCYLRGHGFVVAHTSSTCSTAMIQTLLLVAQYQQGTMRSNECWLTTGNATRMALGLGFHRSTSSSSGLGPLEIELRKRLWWGCFSLDRVSSMIYGRPIGIPHVRTFTTQNNLPQSVDDKYIARGEPQPEGVPSLNAFFVNTVNLYRVMDEILERLQEASTTLKSEYSALSSSTNVQPDRQSGPPASSSNAVAQLAAILQLDGLLLNWHESLPYSLRFSIDEVEQNADFTVDIQRQRVILKIRFLGMRILLHRQTLLFLLQPPEGRRWPRSASQKWPPLFSDGADEISEASCDSRGSASTTTHSTLETHLARLSASLCVASAQMQIEAVTWARPLKLTGAWWWDFHFVFNSLCVVFGAMGLRNDDLAAILPDLPKTKLLISRGFSSIHDMASRGGPKVAQSEKFLKRLMRATIRRSRKETNDPKAISPDETSSIGAPTQPHVDNNGSTDNNFAQASLNSLLPGFQPDSIDILSDDSGRVDGVDWPANWDNVFSPWMGTDEIYVGANGTPNATINGIENLIQSSFDTWTALGGSFQPPINMGMDW